MLDVGCGIGRHVVAFARRSVLADGVDLSPTYVERARELAVDTGVGDRTRFVVGDMRDLASLDVADGYDLVTSLYSTFGYFDDETNEAVLRAMAGRLVPGGTLVVDTRNKEQVVCGPDESVTRVDDLLYVQTREYDSLTSRVRSRIRVLDDPAETLRGVFEFDVRVYAPVELVGLFERVGLVDVAAWGSLTGTAVTREAPRLVVRGRRLEE